MTGFQACPECGASVAIGRLSCGECGALLASVEGRRAAEAPPRAVPLPPVPPMPMVPPPALQAAVQSSLPIPGSYLPPSIVLRSAPATVPAPPPPLAASPRPPPPRAAPLPPVPAPLPHGPEPAATIPARPARVPVLELPFALAPGVGPRLAAIGAAVTVVAFVMPWIPDRGVTLGGAPGSGYFATWGLAAIGNVLPFLLAWASLGLVIFPNPLPRYATLGLLPVFLGGFLAGVAWTNLGAQPGIGIGLWALVAGALLLLAGGTLDLRAGRAAANRS
jgi:hypothetical protein